MNDLTPTSTALLNFNPSGNITPPEWFKHIRYTTTQGRLNKPDLLAINLLADFLYWYKPQKVLDEKSGKLLGYKKKFAADKMQKKYIEMADHFGVTKTDIKKSCKLLEKLKLISLEFRTITVNNVVHNNVLFIDLNVPEIKKISEDFPSGKNKNKKPPLPSNSDRPSHRIQIDPPIEFDGTNTETTPKITTKITKEKSVVPKNEAEEEIKSLLEKDIQLNSSSPSIYSLKNQQDVQTLISEYPLSQIKEAIPKIAKHPRFGKRFSYGGYLMYIRDFLYSKKDKDAQGLSINYFQKPKPRDGEYDGNAHSKMSFAENSA